jgi:Spy/CpxP family protein refolding chaperone
MMNSEAVRKASLLGLAIVLGAMWTMASSTLSWADGRDHGGHGHERPNAGKFIWHVLKAKEVLGLSDEQEAKLRTIGTNVKKDHVRKEAEIELAEIDMHQLFHQQDKQGNPDNIEGAIRKLYALKAELRIALFKAFKEARGVLTPEQLKKLRELHEKERCSMDRKRSAHHGGYGQPGEEEMGGGRPAEHQ